MYSYKKQFYKLSYIAIKNNFINSRLIVFTLMKIIEHIEYLHCKETAKSKVSGGVNWKKKEVKMAIVLFFALKIRNVKK